VSVKHEAAVLHILNRVVIDRNFSHLMMGTESLHLCLQAEADRTGKTVEECEQWLHKRMELEDQRRQSKVATVEILVDNPIGLEQSRPKSSGLHALAPIDYLEATVIP
jgi:hypothetical protein